MTHYIINFTVYILAMSGLIAFALFIYKKVTNGTALSKNSKNLSIEESMMINPRKSLMIVKAGKERFLIASDIDKTSLIAKLNSGENNNSVTVDNKNYQDSTIVDLNQVKNSIDKENMDILFPKNNKNDKKKLKIKENEEQKLVHFEVIKDKNPNLIRARKSDNKRKNVTIEVGQVKNHGLSTIKEIVHKINEL